MHSLHISEIVTVSPVRIIWQVMQELPAICLSSAGKVKDTQNKSHGNRDLYTVFYMLAMQQIQINIKGQARNPVMPVYFESKISEGKTKIQALLCIMRRLVSIIYSMMKKQTVYRLPEIKIEDKKEKMISLEKYSRM